MDDQQSSAITEKKDPSLEPDNWDEGIKRASQETEYRRGRGKCEMKQRSYVDRRFCAAYE